VVVIILFLMGILGISGCKTVEKYKASPQYPADCANDFPVKVVSGKPDTVTMPGTVIDCDSVIAANLPTVVTIYDTDTVVKTVNVNRTVQCPPSRTITITDTVISTAALEACQRTLFEERAFYQKQIDKLQEGADRLQGKLSKRSKQRNWLALILAAAALYSQRHKIIKFFA